MTLSLRSSFDRAPRRAFYLSGNRLAAYHWRQGRIVDALLFQLGEEGLEEFSAYLEEVPEMPAYLLVDVVEEEYRRDTIPHVIGKDRSDIIRYRSERLFRETPYWHAQLQGRAPEGRKDDRVLYTALTSPGNLRPWIERLQQAKVPLAGIYSLPLLSAALLPHLGAGKDGNTLLVTLQGAGNLRQSFFQGPHLKLSRLAHMPALGPSRVVETTLEEVEKLRRYLNSLRLLTREHTLQVYILTTGQLLAEFREQCRPGTNLMYNLVDLAGVGARIALRPELITPHADNLFAHLLLQAAPSNHYATPAETRYYRLHRIANRMLAGAVALLLVGIAAGGFEAVEGLLFKQRAEAAAQQADFYHLRYQEARAGLPPTPVEAQELQGVVEAVDRFTQGRASPLDLLSVVSLGLAAHPGLGLERIEWGLGAGPDAAPGELQLRPNAAAGRRGRGATAGPADGLYQLALVHGRVDVVDGNAREALATVRAFAQRLESTPGVEQVSLVTLPLDVSSAQSLRGDLITSGQRRTERSPFTVRVVYRRVDEAV